MKKLTSSAWKTHILSFCVQRKNCFNLVLGLFQYCCAVTYYCKLSVSIVIIELIWPTLTSQVSSNDSLVKLMKWSTLTQAEGLWFRWEIYHIWAIDSISMASGSLYLDLSKPSNNRDNRESFSSVVGCTAGFLHFLSCAFSPSTSVFCCPLHNS